MQLVQIFGLWKYDHFSPALKELKLFNVEDQLYLRDAVLVYNVFKSLHNLTPSLSENFIRNFEVHIMELLETLMI